MKRYILLPCLALLLHLSAYAQTTLTKPAEEYGFNQNTVVTSAKGLKYKYADWSRLVATGKYQLKPVDAESDSTVFILTPRDTAKGLVVIGLPKPTLFFKKGNHMIFLNMTDVNGRLIASEDLKGKIVVVSFWFIACPPCRYEMPELNILVDKYKNDKNVVFLALSIDKKEDLQRFLKVSPFKYNVIGDAEAYFSFYGVKECPINLVISPKGTIAFQSQGYNNGMVPLWIDRTIKDIKTEEIKALLK
jgi:thiol-disulfide isomerase/thioredoxin